MTFEVTIVYRGCSNYLVEAATPEEAQQKARDRYALGDETYTMATEDIERVEEPVLVP